ncbi:receptor lectin kinase [Rhynchospora pubera]|uniref:non-specific serine/threonine protein kinase n=2 Tax=Rhynchospora pubera TaxID=906938 RepID=A0AAV8ERH4_9POAL|nr:receptor lectin kinase [Rhynchospora pubera]
MAISSVSKRIKTWLFSSIYFPFIVSRCYSLSFDFNFTETDRASFNYTGTASHVTQLGAISLNSVLDVGNNAYQRGRAFYNQPMLLWDNTTGEVTSFSTSFSFKVTSSKNQYGDGFAFFLSEYPPPTTDAAGGSLGLFNDSTLFIESANHILAVEFDTFYNGWDPLESNNVTVSHIGIDINKINSTVYKIIPNYLFIDNNMTAQISYNNLTQNMSLFLSREDNRTINYSISTTVDLKSILPKKVAIGFSASTGAAVEYHLIYSWSFESTLEAVPSSIGDNKGLNSWIIGAVVASVVIFLFFLGILLYFLRRKYVNKKRKDIEQVYDDTMDDEFEKGRGPKRFQYNELAAATKDFSENEKLGEGGFGSVYRGILVDNGVHVAIKRVSKGSKQGKKEYISEVKIISQLRHRNLVQLLGWCHDRGELMLVYELMHNGSLDVHLYHKDRVLTWPMRHQIALGLGSALLYLHRECEQCVVHRDIKPSNVMLDSFFNAKLGDFGLARIIEHDSAAQTIPAGTMGYMAPECVITGKASTQSDVYSFGVVLIEIACGRRPVVLQEDESKVRLVEWAWCLYGSNSILDAIDSQLNGDFEAQEAERLMIVGLWCVHPDYTLRPSIRQALSVLQFEAPLPNLPFKMPELMYTNSVDSRNFSSSTSFGATSGVVSLNISHTTSSSATSKVTSSSLDTAWLFKEEAV